MDHKYNKEKLIASERLPSYFLADTEHGYGKTTTPKKNIKRKREETTPTGITPLPPAKLGQKAQTLWTEDEKAYFVQFVQEHPRRQMSLKNYWKKVSEAINEKFTGVNRNGLACKGLAKRLSVNPDSVHSNTMDELLREQGFSVIPQKPILCDAGTQTELSLPIQTKSIDVKEGEWLFIEPKKELKEGSSGGAKYLNKIALRRLRQFPCLSKEQKAILIDILCSGTPRQFARALLSSPLSEEIKSLILFDIEMEARESCSKSSVLSQKAYKDLTGFTWSSILKELGERQGTLAEVLLAVALPTSKIGDQKRLETLCPVVGTIYGMLMRQRSKQLSAVQKIVSATLANEQAHQKIYDRLQKIGVSLSHNGMLDLMSIVSGNFNSELIESVREGKKFRLIGDNVNFHVGVAHERQNIGKLGHMEHWFGSAAIIQNADFTALPDIAPQHDLRHVPFSNFLLSQIDFEQEVFYMSHLAAQILVQHFPWLKFAQDALNDDRDVLPGLNMKNKVIPLPVLHKNEQKYADVVEILDSYQELCENTFNRAEKPAMKVQIGGDQLTRERFTGARRLRAAALTESERLEALGPVSFELFHLQMTVLNIFYQILYNTDSTEPFTLHSQKIRLLRMDADGLDVKNHYDSCKDLADSVIRAFVVEAACEHFGVHDTELVPENLPDHSQMSPVEIQHWLVEQVKPIIEKVVKSTQNVLNGNQIDDETSDQVMSYGNIVIELGLVFMELCNVVKRPNRDRLLQILKYLMLILKGHNSRSKYALEILRLLCNQYALLSERAAHESAYGLFVNNGKTIIPADLQMEYLVRLTKGHLKSMCSNVTEQSLMKRSSSFFGMNEISEHFDKESCTIIRAQKHKRLSSFDDEKKIITSLRAVRPFFEIERRTIPSLRKAPKNPVTKLVLENYIEWIELNKLNFFYEL